MYQEKINNLDVSEKWKSKFLTIDRAKPIVLGLVPRFENPKELNFSAKFNFVAFFFNIIYYAIKGMWKKAIVILGINILLSIIVAMINPNLVQLVGFGIAGLSAGMANNDFYRFKVLDEGNFWW